MRKDGAPVSDVEALDDFWADYVPGFFRPFDVEEELSGMFGGCKVDLRTPEDLRDKGMAQPEVQYVCRWSDPEISGSENMTTSVFISHVASESDIAIWIKKEVGELLGRAVKFFVSSDGNDIAGGDRWLEKIEAELKGSQTVLVLCSAESVRRPWVNFEAGGAWMAGKRVVPLCHGGMEPGKLPQPLATLQAYSLYDPKDLRQLVSLLAESAGVKPPQFDPADLVRTLPSHTQASTNAKSLGSSETRPSHTGRDTPSAPAQRVDRSAYEHDKRSGIHRHRVTQQAVCTNCLLQDRASPLTESPQGWRCEVKDCGKFYSNPDFDPPRAEPYDPLSYA